MGEPYKYQSSWKTEDLFKNFYTKDEIDVLLAAISAAFNIPIYASAPASPVEGQAYLSSADDKIYIFYFGTWQALHTLSSTPPAIGDGQLMGLLCLTYQT
jgi:hypothetical protein